MAAAAEQKAPPRPFRDPNQERRPVRFIGEGDQHPEVALHVPDAQLMAAGRPAGEIRLGVKARDKPSMRSQLFGQMRRKMDPASVAARDDDRPSRRRSVLVHALRMTVHDHDLGRRGG